MKKRSTTLSDKGKVYSRGMKRMPDYVAKALSGAIKRELAKDGHGISFPDTSGCQMRIVRQGKDRGGLKQLHKI